MILIGCAVLAPVLICCLGGGGFAYWSYVKAKEAQAILVEEMRAADEAARREAERRHDEARQQEEQAQQAASQRAEIMAFPAPLTDIDQFRRQRDRRTRHITARATRVLGSPGVSVGDTCEFDVRVLDRSGRPGYWCRALVECNGRRIYGVDQPSQNGFFYCNVYDEPAGVAGEDRDPTGGREDPFWQIDTRENRFTVLDDDTSFVGGQFRVDAEITAVRLVE